MTDLLNYDFSGIARSAGVVAPTGHPFHDAWVTLSQRAYRLTFEDRVRAVHTMIESAIEYRSTSPTSPSTTHVWDDPTADARFLGMKIEDFIGRTRFLDRVDEARARQAVSRRPLSKRYLNIGGHGPPPLRDLFDTMPRGVARSAAI